MNYADLASPDFYKDPYPLYSRLRGSGRFVSIAPSTVITGHAETIKAILLDRKMGKAQDVAIRSRYGETGPDQPVFRSLLQAILMLNAPAHTRLRTLMMKAFNARQIEAMRDVAASVAHDLIDRLPGEDVFDLITGFAVPMPVQIICKLLGISVDDAPMLSSYVDKMAQALEAAPLSAEQLSVANAATERLNEYFSAFVASRRQHPGNDLLSSLLAVNEGGDTLTTDEIIANVIFLFAAGHETTANMIGNALIALHQHPQQLARLRANPNLAPQAVAECIRFDSSVQTAQRVALEDTEVDGVALPKGTIVLMSLGSANRDPAQYSDPDSLNIERADHVGQPLMFSAGSHYCLGARLAMLELEAALRALLERLPTLELINLHRLEWHSRNTLRGVKELTGAASIRIGGRQVTDPVTS